MSSGSALAAALGLGKVMSSSRKALARLASSRTTCPGSLRWSLSCAHTSALISSALHFEATLPVRRDGRSQSDTSTERIPPTCPSPRSREVGARPELALRDRGQRPVGVAVDRVPGEDRHVAVQVEHDPVHPARAQPARSRPGAARRPTSCGLSERAQLLDRHRRDVVVGGHRLARAVVVDRHAGDPPVAQSMPSTVAVGRAGRRPRRAGARPTDRSTPRSSARRAGGRRGRPRARGRRSAAAGCSRRCAR